jgi:uncharacterized protein (TIGR00251 family)
MTDLDLVERAGGVVVKVRVAPGASRERIVGSHGTALKVAVAAPPEKGRANDAVAKLLAAALAVPSACVSLASGPASRDKKFFVLGISAQEVRRRLAPFLDAG